MKTSIFNLQKNLKKGQTLVTLLFFLMMIITITTAAIAVVIVNSQTSARFVHGERALSAAEAGVENALIRLLRDSNYGGETLSLTDSYVTIVVSGSSTKTITSQGHSGNFIRTIQVIAGYTNNILTVTSWRELQ